MTPNGAVTMLAVTGLTPNTTYFARVGASGPNDKLRRDDAAGAEHPDRFDHGSQVYSTTVTAVTANWEPLASAVGYRLEAHMDSGFTSLRHRARPSRA